MNNTGAIYGVAAWPASITLALGVPGVPRHPSTDRNHRARQRQSAAWAPAKKPSPAASYTSTEMVNPRRVRGRERLAITSAESAIRRRAGAKVNTLVTGA